MFPKTYPQDVEGRKDDDGEEERVVVEDGEGGSLVLSNLQQQHYSASRTSLRFADTVDAKSITPVRRKYNIFSES